MRCSYCGSDRHPYSHCPKTWGGTSARLHLRCSYCGRAGHNYEACTKHMGGGKLLGSVRVLDWRQRR